MEAKSLTADFRDFVGCLNDRGVEYLLIGGHAVAYHGYVRPTQDMDIWIAVTVANAERLASALDDFFGDRVAGVSAEMFLDAEQVTRFGVRPNLIEILGKIDGVEFEKAFAQRVVAELDGVRVNIIGMHELKQNKKATGRNKDLADLDNLP